MTTFTNIFLTFVLIFHFLHRNLGNIAVHQVPDPKWRSEPLTPIIVKGCNKVACWDDHLYQYISDLCADFSLFAQKPWKYSGTPSAGPEVEVRTPHPHH